MADLTFDGMLRVYWVPAIGNIGGPTVAELGAGIDLTPRLTPDGLDVSSDTGTIDNTKMNSTSNQNRVGRRSYTLGVTYVRGTADDDDATEVEETLAYRATGFLVVDRDIAWGTAWAAGQRAEVYPAECGEANPDAPGPDTLQTVNVPLTVTGDPRGITNRATVVA
jgi:hypothetical protein